MNSDSHIESKKRRPKSPYAPSDWNPWHGCTKISPGCKYCYMYRSDAKHGRDSTIVAKTSDFDLPIRKKRDGSWKIPSGNLVWTCFTSDFFHVDADVWRDQVWEMIRTRRDLYFFFITKRIDRLAECVPPDWGNGWDNVEIACTVENQDRANYRLPIYASAPVKRKTIICEPLLEDLNLLPFLQMRRTENSQQTKASPYSLNSRQVRVFHQVVVGGESGLEARVCNYDWVLNIRQQCLNTGTAFTFRQTGAHFVKDGYLYNIPRKLHHIQAKKANIGYSGDSYTEDFTASGWKRKNLFQAVQVTSEGEGCENKENDVPDANDNRSGLTASENSLQLEFF